MNKIFIVLSLLFLVQSAYSIMFEVRAADEKCIVEEFRQDTLVNGNFEVSDKLSRNMAFPYEVVMSSMQMKFYVRGPTGDMISVNHDATKGVIAFNAQEPGDYSFCFLDNYRPGAQAMPLSRTVSLSIKTGVEANDYSDVITKGQLKPSEIELKKIEDVVDAIKTEILYMKNREETMRNTNESTNSRVANLSIFCFFVLIASAFFQISYLKKYFKQKKLI
ncbi:hypothetical protein DICPUDRAFT_94091 [Dictyostelium purpureum]|uniref:GOLD domain-containing protein n=1 Tax=Dictyostelium purpureum TaxID=5786 RepID=F0ZFA9_DICPU|nr:uncharacterized protein DICPUDRAFT_94091 [Dictyostelium purpureum]EGC37353.1 hypothetical protein DICPUDRAFT_94091 [Dictyostelium purpureum]|eukprot:XP_003286094.1 hypothetical protein DICPUDRAFT_94091 [Dictyostelium purpureum]